ncbi:MAG: substrate-binding domain-containing protein [Verrucomicrobia bacterium]|nr:substrate-binding domain-containing protein [Verrucomicrobiota bacterium]
MHGETIRVFGSDLLSGALQQALRDFAQADDLQVDVALSGSSIARREIDNGRAHIAILAAPDGRLSIPDHRAVPLGFQVVTVIVHESNPVTQLSIPQLVSIYAQGAPVNIEDWGALGGGGVWRARKINMNAIRMRNNIALEIFNNLVLGDREMKTAVTFWQDPRALGTRVMEDNSAIAIMPSAAQRPLTRTLAIAAEAGGQAFPPTPENVLFGDYPLRMPFYIVFRNGSEDTNPTINALLRFLLSDEIAQKLTAAGFMPLVQRERRQYLEDWSQ